jgi:hypothetical protein
LSFSFLVFQFWRDRLRPVVGYEPQYLIKRDKTDHLAMHKGGTLKKISKSKRSTKTSAVEEPTID